SLRKALSVSPLKRYQEVSEFTYDLRTPNKDFINRERPPLIERNPLVFWRGLSLLLLLVIVVQAIQAQ
ncbi:MAG: bifunctional protein-serine/threonine kinase/phosphatase, partial [Porticoccaceae bacterium]